MAREYFCAYHSYLKSMRNLTDAECGRLFRALLQYSAGDKSINLQGRESIAFDFMTEQIDRDEETYNAKCAKLSQNGRQANATKCHQMVANGSKCHQGEGKGKGKGEGENKEVVCYAHEKEMDASVSPPAQKKREEKHRHGKNGHVLLTDSEYDNLKTEYPNADEAIEYLDAYIAEKDYKAKSHYLSIKRWVFDALREQAVKKAALTEKERRYGEKPPDEGRLDFNLEDIFEKPPPKET